EEELAAKLQQGETSLLSHKACVNYRRQNIEETNICGRLVRAAFGTADSGWPLICGIDRCYKQIGVANWGSRCHSKSPRACTRVSAHRHQISSVPN
ncbi:CTRB protein, partial [Caloenas nicobarica]|nr:CTRB protein [Caloenas nicobarica]